MKGVRSQDSSLRSSFCSALSHFATAILDYVSNIHEMPDTTVTVAHFNTEANSIYETLFSSWLSNSKDLVLKLQVMLLLILLPITLLQVLAAMADLTPLLSPSLMADRAPSFLTSLLQLYKRLPSASLEVTLCLSPMLELATSSQPSTLLEPLLDPLFNTMFQQVCLPVDYDRPASMKNHNELLRCYDTMMAVHPTKLVAGLLGKADQGEERSRVGALVVVRHLLNMPTEQLGERLEMVVVHIAAKLNEANPSVQKVVAQIIARLGHHGCVQGERGRQLVAFIIRLCGVEEGDDGKGRLVARESLGAMCANILQLLATSVPSVETVLWPHTIDYLLQVHSTWLFITPQLSLFSLTLRRPCLQ